MDIKRLHDKYRNKELTVTSYINEIYENIEKNKYNSYITLNKEEALKKAKKLDKQLENGEFNCPLFGVPIAVKDNIITKGLRTTAASKALKDFIPFFNATVIDKLEETGAIIIGKANMDEFAMGSSSETSYFGNSINPYNPELTPGGSSSGSATAVAGDEAVLAIGTDTGGSVRNPADYCHIVGFAPTFGAISRYGAISMANSFDRVGVMGNNVKDTKVLFNILRGKSEQDPTSIDVKEFDENLDIKDLNIAVFELRDEYNIDAQIVEEFNNTVERLKSLGANIETVSINNLEYINDAYTVITCVEVQANMARIDGLRYGESIEEYETTEGFYINNRSNNFGEEVKRRFALGTYFASKETEQKYYKQAMKIRANIRQQMDEILSKYDIVISPTTTKLPRKVGETMEDSRSSFDTGIFNTITNLSNFPSISIPMDKERLGSMQIIGNRAEDMKLLSIAEIVEESIL